MENEEKMMAGEESLRIIGFVSGRKERVHTLGKEKFTEYVNSLKDYLNPNL